MSNYLGDYDTSSTIYFTFTTVDSTGAPTTPTSTSCAAYFNGSTTEVNSGITWTTAFDSRAGLNHIAITTASDGTTYATGREIHLICTAGSCGTVNLAGYALGQFSLRNRTGLYPTTAGRTLDVSAGGEAGVDWANVGSPTTALALTNTTISSTQPVDLNTIKTNTVVNGGTVTFPTNATLASTTNITAGTIATVSGNVNGSVGSVTGAVGSVTGAVGSVTGNVGGNVVGSVGSVTGLTASDVGAIKTKTDFLPSATAGAAGGVFISGTNSGLTVTGALNLKAGLVVTQSTSNTSAISAVGNGTGHGISASSGSGATGNGMHLVAASTVGSGLRLLGTSSGAAFLIDGGSMGPGIQVTSGTDASAISLISGLGSGHGISIVPIGDGAGININAPNNHGAIIVGGGNNHNGMELVGGINNGIGLALVGDGDGQGLFIAGGDTAAAVSIDGNLAITAGITITQDTPDGAGIVVTGDGNGAGIQINSGDFGIGLDINGVSMGMDIVATDGGAAGARIHGTAGYGLLLSGGGSGNAGLVATGDTNAAGIYAIGVGNQAGLKVAGGTSGAGAAFIGGSSSGSGISVTTTHGNGIDIEPAGDTSHGIYVAGGDAGISDGIKVDAGVGGVPIRADITGSITGNLIGDVTTLSVNSRTEPGQGAPAVSTTITSKVDYLYKAWRNKVTQSTTQYQLFADNTTTVDQKTTASDDGTTFTRGEIGGGP